MTIDLHAHYCPEELAIELKKRGVPPFISENSLNNRIFHMPHGSLNFPKSFSDIEGRREFMAENKIRHQVLSFPGLFGVDSIKVEESLPLVKIFNDRVAEICQRFPNNFSGLAALPMADIDLATAEFKRARDQLGLIGAILPNNFFITEDHAKKTAPIFETAQKIGGHLFIHPGRRPDEVPETYQKSKQIFPDFAAERLALTVQHNVSHCMVTLLFSNFLDTYPDISLHVANLGGTFPMVVERMDNVSRTRTPNAVLPSSRANRIHVDCSSLGPRAIEIAAAIFGAEKILFGTDCPIFSTNQSLHAVNKANISDSDKRLILNDNAEQLLAVY